MKTARMLFLNTILQFLLNIGPADGSTIIMDKTEEEHRLLQLVDNSAKCFSTRDDRNPNR